MTLHTLPREFDVSRSLLRVPLCPECGDMLLAPEASEFAGRGRVRHHWSCEACGHVFRTAVLFAEA
jgi:hypothetical protein